MKLFGQHLFPIEKSAIIKFYLCITLVLSGFFANAQEMKIYPGCTMTLSGNINVVVNNAAFKNNGSFNAGNSTVLFTGSTDTTISYISGTSNTRFNNLSLTKSAF